MYVYLIQVIILTCMIIPSCTMFSNFLVLDNLIDKVVENELRNPFLRCLYFYYLLYVY